METSYRYDRNGLDLSALRRKAGKPIQQMLDEQVPLGTPEGVVNAFLSARDYPSEPGEKKGTIVATIRHIDTERVQPVTARVTFYFDENGKLKDYELQRTRNEPIPQ